MHVPGFRSAERSGRHLIGHKHEIRRFFHEVDKFQGQEAPIVIWPLASSSAADAPRGMQFLYSPNRFNVATSRGRCLAFVVASPEIFLPECKTPEQMRFANAFCRFQELADVIELPVIGLSADREGRKVSVTRTLAVRRR